MNFVGIDLHKHYSQFVVLDQNGKVVTQAKLPTEREAVSKFLSGLKGPAKAAVEATRNWYWFYDLVESLTEEAELVCPSKMRVIAESTVKTDRIDARVIAELLRVNYLPTCYVPPQEVRQVRELLRERIVFMVCWTSWEWSIHLIIYLRDAGYSFSNRWS